VSLLMKPPHPVSKLSMIRVQVSAQEEALLAEIAAAFER
jgi:hypothetical protein